MLNVIGWDFQRTNKFFPQSWLFSAFMDTSRASLVGLGMGIPFGIAFRYAKIQDPSIIRSQLELKNFTMMKTFLSAVSVGGLCLSGLYATSNIAISGRAFHPITTPLGGILLGSGMYLVGSCPGTIWAQVGAGVQGLCDFILKLNPNS